MKNELAVRERIEAAARSPYNLLGLSVCVAGTAIMLSPWPLLAGAVAETIYLGVVAARSTRTPSARSADAPAIATPASLPPDLMTGEVQGRYLRLESTFRLIRLQLDEGNTVHLELVEHLRFLMDRFVYFAGKQELFYERLRAVASEAVALKANRAPAAGILDLELSHAAMSTTETATLDEWVREKMKQAHEGCETELREIAYRRETLSNSAGTELEAQAQALLRKNKQVDRLGKTLLNVHYELQLIDKKFAVTSQELSTRRMEQVLADIKALVVQTQSLTRTVEDILPGEAAPIPVAP